jgi:ribose 5-phosphate isomerase
LDERLQSAELEKFAAAGEAARLVEPGMLVGLGGGSTVDRSVKLLSQTRPDASQVAASRTTDRGPTSRFV